MNATRNRATGAAAIEVAARSAGRRRPPATTAACGRRLIGDLVVGHVVEADHLGHMALVNRAQRLNAVVQRISGVLQTADLVVELLGQPMLNLASGYRKGRILLRRSADAGAHGVEAQRSTAEHRDRRRTGMPPNGLVQPQQRLDVGSSRVFPVADLRERIPVRSAATSHFLFGQIQLGDTRINEVDEPLNAISGNRHTTHTTARNPQYPRLAFRSGYVSSYRD